MFIAGLIADQGNIGSRNGFVEIDYRKNIKDGIPAYQDSLAANYGGLPGDYAVYEVPNKSQEDLVAAYPEDFLLEWVPVDTITDLDFSPLTSKRILVLSMSTASILGNDNDTANFTVTLYENDGMIVATDFDDFVYFRCNIDGRTVILATELVNGVAGFSIRGSRGSVDTYGIGGSTELNAFRISAPVSLTIYEVL